jgi:hypothetical protein
MRQICRFHGNELKTEIAIRFFMDTFETEGLFKVDSPRFGRRNEAQIPDEEYGCLKDIFPPDPLQFLFKDAGYGESKVLCQGSGADSGSIVKLHLDRLSRGPKLALPLQARDQVEERDICPRLGHTPRLAKGDDIGCSFFYDAEAIYLQLAEDGCLS